MDKETKIYSSYVICPRLKNQQAAEFTFDT